MGVEVVVVVVAGSSGGGSVVIVLSVTAESLSAVADPYCERLGGCGSGTVVVVGVEGEVVTRNT